MTPKAIKQTVRQRIISLLSEEDYSSRELSQAVGIPEKDVYSHLTHVARTLDSQKKELVMIDCRCLECDYLFKTRKRYTRPGRCPQCRGERIREPRFLVRSRKRVSRQP